MTIACNGRRFAPALSSENGIETIKSACKRISHNPCYGHAGLAVDYDLVINNGRVIDPETMFDDVANVGVKDGKIAIITKPKIRGKEIINAKAHVVA